MIERRRRGRLGLPSWQPDSIVASSMLRAIRYPSSNTGAASICRRCNEFDGLALLSKVLIP